MAGDWIKMRSDLQTHPKVVRIASALNADRLRAVGGLHAVWCLFDAHSVDGSLDGYDPETLDTLIGCPGFAKAMAAVGWLIVLQNSLSLPRFDEHNGRSAKRRATEAERKRAARTGAECPQPVRETSAADADKLRTREEKRRDIKKEDPPDLPKKAANEDPNHRQKKTKRAPDDFQLTDAMRDWASTQCSAIDVAYHTQKFLDHTFGTARQDWTATWRNWLRTEQERKHEADQRSLARPGRGETVDDKLRRLRGDGKPRVGEPDGGVRGSVLPGVWERA